MLLEQVREIVSSPQQRRSSGIMEKIRYIEELEERGIIEPSTPQTAYRYPIEILPNGRTLGCKTR